MQNKTKIILIRHGESLGNANRTMLGHTDLDLSPLGYTQAETTANYLKNEKIDKIYSSDLIRAYNTAVPHAKMRKIDIISSKMLREIKIGGWENLKVEEIIEKWGSDAYSIDWKKNFGTFKFPDGESVKVAGERFYREVLRISSENQGKTILITAHAAVIRAFWGIISGISWENLASTIDFPSNASYSVAYFDGNSIIPESYSNDSHLSGVGITCVNSQ